MDARLFDNTQTLRASVLCGLSFFWALIAFLMALINFWSQARNYNSGLSSWFVLFISSVYLHPGQAPRSHAGAGLSVSIYSHRYHPFRDLHETISDGNLCLELFCAYPFLYFYLNSLCFPHFRSLLALARQRCVLAITQ